MELASLLTLLLFLPSIILLLTKATRTPSHRLPPGPLGVPFIGQSLSFLRALQANRAERWLQDRVEKYGSVSKLTMFGTPTVFVHGQAANKFVFASDSNTLSNQQPQSFKMLFGERNLFELSGEDHKRVRGALMTFLKPEVLKQYVGKMDCEMRKHLEMHWQGKNNLTVLPLMKTLTFNIICSLLFGLESEAMIQKFNDLFQPVLKGMLSVPVNLPFTRFNRGIQASASIQSMVKEIICEKRLALQNKKALPNQDLITCLLSIHGEEGAALLSEQEIIDNVMIVVTAGYDTTSALITFMVRLMAMDPVVYDGVLTEQEEIAKSKTSGELLSWEDLTKMKYTWTVALETLRIFPPIFGSFRTTLKDVEFGGYLIPKGWQVFWAANMTHMDEFIFSEPMKFDPERFGNQASIPPYCYVAFGGGARICPGFEFAKIEVLVAIHYLVIRFTWKLCGKNNEFGRDPMLVPTQGLPIQIVPRTSL